MGKEVQRIKTEISEPQMAKAIIEAWRDLFKSEPSKEQVALVLAQNSLETGNRKAMWNYNVGNIKANINGKYDYFYLKGPEQIAPGKWQQFRMTFRAYPNIEEGVKDYLNFLSKSSRYASAWQHILHPDPAAFSKALKNSGYYTANEDAYTKGLTTLYSKFNKSKSYELVQSGKSPLIENVNQQKTYLAQQPIQGIEEILNQYLQQISASEKTNKKLYKKFLPSNNILISIKADYTDAVEFARILCAALDEELTADTFTHSDDNNIEVQCVIHGPAQDCMNAVQAITSATVSAFKKATIKLGGIEIQTQFVMNKKSSYKEISLKTANNQYRKFLLKFI